MSGLRPDAPPSAPPDATNPYVYPAMPYPANMVYMPGGAVIPEHPDANMILVLGILGVLFLVPAPIALVMGARARKDCLGEQYASTGTLTAGYVLGIIGTVFLGIFVLAMIFFFVFILGMFSMFSNMPR